MSLDSHRKGAGSVLLLRRAPLGLHDLDLYSACGAGNLAGSNHFEKLRFSPPSSSDSGRFRELIRFPTPYVSPVLASRQGGKRGV